MSTGTQGVVGFWAGVERRFQPAGTTTILDNVVVASRLPVFAGLLAGVNAVVMGAISFAHGESSAGWLALLTALVYLGMTAYYISTGKVKVFTLVILWASFVNNIASHVLLGGFVWSGQIDLRGRRVDAYLLRPPPS